MQQSIFIHKQLLLYATRYQEKDAGYLESSKLNERTHDVCSMI